MTIRRAGILLLAVLWLAGCAATMPGNVYDSAGESKAKGAHVRVNYPAGWEKKPGDNKDMLVQFLRRNESVVEMLMLQVYRIDEEGAKSFFPMPGADAQEERYVMWKKTIESLSDTKVVSVADVAVPGDLPAVLIELTMLPSSFKGDIYTRMKMLHVYKKERMVIVSCGTGAETARKAEVDLLLKESTSPVCQQYFDSLRFVE